RTWWYRRELPVGVAGPFAAALVGAVLGAVAALRLPSWAVSAAMIAAALGAAVNQASGARIAVPRRAIAPAGLVVGLSSTAGGAGILAGPILQSLGLRGGAYLAALSAGGVAMHVGRLAALGAGGALDGAAIRDAGWLAVAIPVGNAAGSAVRSRVGDRASGALELAASLSVVALALAGVGL
ncbi:MAG: hypothetical protein ABMB14_39640, partial [Myxococcota bacterium]